MTLVLPYLWGPIWPTQRWNYFNHINQHHEELLNDFSSLKVSGRFTGGAGFIGHNLALELKKHGAEPHVVDGLQVNSLGYYTSGYTDNPRAELYIGFINERLRLLRESGVGLHVIDIRDYHVVTRTLTQIDPDVVIHLAAIAHANRSNKDPFSTFDHSCELWRMYLTHQSQRNTPHLFLIFDGLREF